MSFSGKYNHFYITLPSSGCLDIYPDNTVTSFKTALKNEIVLDDDLEYEVALVEIHVEGFVKNINEDIELLTIHRYNDSFSTTLGKLPSGYYRSAAEVLNHINKEFHKFKTTADLRMKITNRQLKLSRYRRTVVEIDQIDKVTVTTTPIFNKLMFKDYYEFFMDRDEKKTFTVKDFNSTKVNIVLPAIDELNIREAFIYADICEYSNIGSDLYPLLRAIEMPIGVNKYFGSTSFNSPHYVKIRSNRLKSIFIYIKTLKGDPWPIVRGHVILKLHFRPISSY